MKLTNNLLCFRTERNVTQLDGKIESGEMWSYSNT
jgi:hypothetical protein